jgi:hypothetical protein
VFIQYIVNIVITISYIILAIVVLYIKDKGLRKSKVALNTNVFGLVSAVGSFFLVFLQPSMIYLNVSMSSCQNIDG